jgi:hypothetical protein
VPEPLIAFPLTEPSLRFDYENRQAIGTSAYIGLKDFGPYDAGERRRTGAKRVRAVIVGRADRLPALKDAAHALATSRLGRFHDVFSLEFVAEVHVPPTNLSGEADSYRTAITEWFDASPYKPEVELAFVLHGDELSYRGASPYFATKAAFMRRGIPTQSIRYDNVRREHLDEFRRYYVANILVACYAKIGGIPWVVQTDAPARPEVTVGVATTAIVTNGRVERYVGISTIFRENGAFALWDITNPERDLEKYEEQLENTVARAINTFETRENRHVLRIACHVSGKRAGYREVEAVRRALMRFPERNISADIVHVTDDAPLWLMDGAHTSLLPESGILTHLTLNGSSAFMHTEGRGASTRFLTRPLRLRIYNETPEGGSLDIYQHLYDLRWMSWRGVRTSSGPVSVAYPKKMARLLAYLHEQEEVEALDILPGLKTNAWFL